MRIRLLNSGKNATVIFSESQGMWLVNHMKYVLDLIVRYSYDEGATWTMHTFSRTKMFVYGILTEPGEHTTVFTIFGSLPSNHSWVVVYVNLKPIFSKHHFNLLCIVFLTWNVGVPQANCPDDIGE